MNTNPTAEYGATGEGLSGQQSPDLLLSQLQQQLRAASQAQQHLQQPQQHQLQGSNPLANFRFGQGLVNENLNNDTQQVHAALSQFSSGTAGALNTSAVPQHAPQVSTSDLLRHFQLTQTSPGQVNDASSLGMWQPSQQQIQDLMSSVTQQPQQPFPPRDHSAAPHAAAPNNSQAGSPIKPDPGAPPQYSAAGPSIGDTLPPLIERGDYLGQTASQIPALGSAAGINHNGTGGVPTRSLHLPLIPPPQNISIPSASQFLPGTNDLLSQPGLLDEQHPRHPGPPHGDVSLAPPDASTAPQGLPVPAGENAPLVLAAKVLTESDIKQSRAILPRIAVESNLPFLLGYRTFGLVMADAAGVQWEFTVKSWANGRADRAQIERKKDRRVYVVEQMARYLTSHQLGVGDVIGIVAVNGRLEMHNRSQDLRAWIERPTYGPSDVVVHPTTVPNKCILLEDIQPEEAVHRQCRRSAVCSKPDGHPGFCVGTQHGSKPRPAGAKLKLQVWPPPRNLLEFEGSHNTMDSQVLPIPLELMPVQGTFLAFRVTAEVLANDSVTMPTASVLKVPASVSRHGGLRVFVEDAAGVQHPLYAVVLDAGVRPEPAEGQVEQAEPDLGPLRWMLSGISSITKAIGCCQDDEVIIERQGNKLVTYRVPVEQLPPVSEQWAFPLRPGNTANDALLCQRSQSCLKTVHHSGTCSTIKGSKRKDRGSSKEGQGSAKRRSEAKHNLSKTPVLAGPDGQQWSTPKMESLVAPHPPAAQAAWPDSMSMLLPPAAGNVSQQEEDLAADVLVALSSDQKKQAPGNSDKVTADNSVVAAAVGGPVTPGGLTEPPGVTGEGLPHSTPPGDTLKTTLEELGVMRDDHGPEQSGECDGEEYLELLMQNAISNLHRDSHDPQTPGPHHHAHPQMHQPPQM